jgi:predicted enzyme related to lactoylglutathione lyase
MPSALGLSAIGQINVPVKDLDRAVAFYRDVLGLPFLFQAGPNLAFFDCNGVRLMLDIIEDPQFDHPSSVLYFPVADLDSSFARLVEHGVAIFDPPHLVAKMEDYEYWMAFFHDGEGNIHAITAEKRP